MKEMLWKKTLAAAAALLIVSGGTPIKPVADMFGGMAITASAEEEYFGECGDNAIWSLDDAGKLTISGMGEMYDYEYEYKKGVVTSQWYSYADEITSVEIQNGVTSIGNYAFFSCTGLTSIMIPDSVTSIGDHAFDSCTGLTSIEIPDNVTSIGNSAFESCTGLTSIEIPDSVTSIGNSAFDECTSLTSVKMSKNVTSIGDYAFSDCSKLTSITIPDRVTSIGEKAFYNCISLTSITIPDSVTSIGDLAFSDCTSLTSVEMSKNVTSIGNSAFSDCTSLTSIKIPDSVTSIGNYVFCNCSKLTSITIPNSVISIGQRAFSDCTSLTSVKMSQNVTSIGEKAFSGCESLSSITIPVSVESIGADAFYSCTGITDVYCYADPSKLTWNEFGRDDFKEDGSTVCHVPERYLADYNKKFGAGSDDPVNVVNVTFVGDLIGFSERLEGYSVSLDGDIGVNFYMELADEIANSQTAYMQFTIPAGSKTETKTVLVKDAIKKDMNGKTYHVFKCNVSAKDMASTIKAQIINGDKQGTEYKYSVKDYADYLLSHTQGNAEYTNAAPLVKAMLNYGAYAQKYFNEGTAFETSGSVEDVTIPVEFKYNADNTSITADGVTFEGATLSLKSETTLSLYFTGLPEGTEFTCGSKTVQSVKNGKYIVARIRGIKAEELKNNFTLTFTGGSVTYNPMTYCYNVLNGGSDNVKLQNVVKALYKYAEAAKPNS